MGQINSKEKEKEKETETEKKSILKFVKTKFKKNKLKNKNKNKLKIKFNSKFKNQKLNKIKKLKIKNLKKIKIKKQTTTTSSSSSSSASASSSSSSSHDQIEETNSLNQLMESSNQSNNNSTSPNLNLNPNPTTSSLLSRSDPINQPPARRIYVQGMVVARNLNENLIPSSNQTQYSDSNQTNLHLQSQTELNQHQIPNENSTTLQSNYSSPSNQPTHPVTENHSSGTHSTDSRLNGTSTTHSTVLIEQATMISRLLTAAAAATASSLLPYAIHTDGSSIQTPTHSSNPDQIPTETTRNSQSSLRSDETTLSPNPSNPGSDSPELHPSPRPGLQSTLRDALRAALGGTLVHNDSEQSSPQLEPNSSSPLPATNTNTPFPILSPSNSTSLSPYSTSSVSLQSVATTNLAHEISSPINATTSLGLTRETTEPGSFSRTQPLRSQNDHSYSPNFDSPSESFNLTPPTQPSHQPDEQILPSSSNNNNNGDDDADPPAGFERFLRDLQVDVGQAILTALGAHPPSAPVVDPDELEERVRMGSALPFWEEDEEEAGRGDEANHPTTRTSTNVSNEDQSSDPSLAFSFFRMHRFDGIPPPPEDPRMSTTPTTTDEAAAEATATNTNTSVDEAPNPDGPSLSNLIPVLLVGVRSAPPNPLIGAIERLARQVPSPVRVDLQPPSPLTTDIANEDIGRSRFSDLRRFNVGDEEGEVNLNEEGNEINFNEGSDESRSVELRRWSQDGLSEEIVSNHWSNQRETNPEVENQTVIPNYHQTFANQNDERRSNDDHPDLSNLERPFETHTPPALSHPSPPRSWLIFVLAGLYPESHPIFTAPSLFVPTGLQQQRNNLTEQVRRTQEDENVVRLDRHTTIRQNSSMRRNSTPDFILTRDDIDNINNRARRANRANRANRNPTSNRSNGLLNRLRTSRNNIHRNRAELDGMNLNRQTQEDLIEEQLLDYETMIRLAELIGQQTHRFHNIFNPNGIKINHTITQAQIDQSPLLKKFIFSDLRDLYTTKSSPSIDPVGNIDNNDDQENTLVLENTIEKCLICLDEYENPDEVRIMKCKHMFHKNCVDQWLVKSSASCPVCRDPAL